MAFSDWSIRTKLSAGFGTMIALCALLGLLAIDTTSRFKGLLAEMHDHMFLDVVTLAEIHDLTLDHNHDLYALLLQGHLEDEHLHHQLAAIKGEVAKKLQTLRDTSSSSTEAMQIGAFEREWHAYHDIAEKIIALHEQGKKAQAELLIRQSAEGMFLSAEEKLIRLIELNTSNAHDAMAANQQLAGDFVRNLAATLLLTLIVGLTLAYLCTRAIVRPIDLAVAINNRLAAQGGRQIALVEAIADGDLQQDLPPPEKIDIPQKFLKADETGTLLRAAGHMVEGQFALTRAMAKMSHILLKTREAEEERDWVKSGLNEANTLLRGDRNEQELADRLLGFLTPYLGAAVGALYLYDEKRQELILSATWALPQNFRPQPAMALGSGILGQAARERRLISVNDMPAAYLPVSSAFGQVESCVVTAQPLVCDDVLFGVIELGSLHPLQEAGLELLQRIAADLALALKVAQARARIEDLLEQAQQQSEELRVQQEELQQSNEELEERAQLLEQQREQISAQNREIELATEQVRRKADDLERVSAYKSEFLANMSHELRSPLNSLMILSGLLQENREGHLSSKEVQFAATINAAGKDLLTLINDILDLSKVEAGHLDLHNEAIAVREVCDSLIPLFQPQAEAKGIGFHTSIADGTVATFESDRQRLQQILRNLLSNACKFTEQGKIELIVRPLRPGEGGVKGEGIAFEIRDSGIGIHADKQQLVFEAFQQADGSTSRKYGGTGLGLSIAQQLARRMGGVILLASTPGSGSTFTLCLPLKLTGGRAHQPPPPPVEHRDEPSPAPPLAALDEIPQPLADDRHTLGPGDRAILIIEDDLRFAQVLLDMVRERHFAVLAAADGETGIALADRFQPSAIILDVMLPHIDGWTVMRHLKDNPRTRHIPVHFVTCLDEERKALAMGAVGYVRKPVDAQQLQEVFGTIETVVEKTVKRLLVVEDDEREAQAMVELLGERNVEITVVPDGQAAIARLDREPFDCIVLDLGLADMTGFDLLEHIRKHQEIHRIPVIIHSGQELSREDEHRLRRYAESIIIKGAQSPDRLLNEVTLFLHLVESGLSPGKQKMIRLVLDQEAMLEGKQVLIVDDDMRNIFSLTSILAEKQLVIHEAENGREALARLDEHPDIDLVLMDIMMPEMDGYDTMRAIRKDPRFSHLPIIAMTAKALKGDQEKCLAAGASDYLSKPIDTGKLFSLLRVWLYPGDERP